MSKENFKEVLRDAKREAVSFSNAIDFLSNANLKDFKIETEYKELDKHWRYKLEIDDSKPTEFHWLEDDFKPTEAVKYIEIIKSNRKYESNLKLTEYLRSFYALCDKYYTNEQRFYVFQVEILRIQGKILREQKKYQHLNLLTSSVVPLESDIFKDIYIEATNRPLSQLREDFDAIHEKYTCASMYEKFCFSPKKSYIDLHIWSNDRKAFNENVLHGKWEDFKNFQSIFKDEKTKEEYDKYYWFLQCKNILKGIQMRNDCVTGNFCLDAVSKLLNFGLTEREAVKILDTFCRKIGLKFKYETLREIQEKQKKAIELKENEIIPNIIGPLDRILLQTITSLRSLQEKKSKITIVDVLEKKKDKLETDSDTYYTDSEEEIAEMNRIIVEIEKIYRSINSLLSACNNIKEAIANAKKEAEKAITDAGGYNGDTAETVHNNLKKLLTTVKNKQIDFDKERQKCYNQITKITDIDGLQQNFNVIATNIENRITEAKDVLVNKQVSLKKIVQQPQKPITRWFILSQILFLVAFLLFYVPFFREKQLAMGFYWLNFGGWLLYIILRCGQYNKYNRAVMEFNDLTDENRKARKPKELRKNIFSSFLVFFILQFGFLIEHYTGFNNITQLINIPKSSRLIFWLFIIMAGYLYIIKRKKK